MKPLLALVVLLTLAACSTPGVSPEQAAIDRCVANIVDSVRAEEPGLPEEQYAELELNAVESCEESRNEDEEAFMQIFGA